MNPAGYAALVLAAAPLGYWRLGEADGSLTVADSSGYGLNGVPASGVTLGLPGAILDGTTAAALDGSSAAAIPVILSLSGLTAITLECWVHLGGLNQLSVSLALSPGKETILQLGQDAPGSVTPTLVVNNVRNTWSSAGAVPLSGWHYLAVTWESGDDASLYLDGTLDSTFGTPITGVINTYTLLTLGNGTAFTAPMTGGLDEVAISPVALTATQIAARYAKAQRQPSMYSVVAVTP